MNLHDDLVSVVIPVYNSEKFLGKSIESVLNQTYKNIEIIVVDDGSNDNSLKILKKYSDRIKIIHQSNQGLAVALQAAMRKIKGGWFKWFSPDDVLYPEAIETLVRTAKKLPTNTIIYSNWELIDENGIKIRDFFESDYNNLENFEFNIRLLDGQQINVNTSLIPTFLFKNGCIFQELKDHVAVDYDFFLRAGILFGTNFYLVSKPLLKYRISSKQLSHKKITKTLNYLNEIRTQILSKLDDKDKEKYISALDLYKKEKPLHKKTMDIGLRMISNLLPSQLSDQLLIFYLNKIRSTR